MLELAKQNLPPVVPKPLAQLRKLLQFLGAPYSLELAEFQHHAHRFKS